MSRCFPFPPQGYVKKTKADDTDLLKKEKHKEKKHRKEKKDKEKKESKEKREKDRTSDGKHRDKKDKHREKKDKDKDKNRISDDKRLLPGQSESHNGEEKPSDEKKLSRKPNHSGEKFSGREKEKDAARTNISGEKKLGGQEKLHMAPVSKDSKFVQDLARRARDEGTAATNQSAEKFTATDRKGGEGIFRLAAKTSGDDRNLDGHGKSKNTTVRNLPGMFQTKVEEIPKPLDRDIDMQIKGKAPKAETWQKERDDNNKLKVKQKHGDNNKEEKNHEKSKHKHGDNNKEEKNKDSIDKARRENVKDRSELNKNADVDKFKEGSGMVDQMDFRETNFSEPLKDREKSTVPEGNIKKRKKDHETNGFLHANDTKLNKLPRLVPSSDRSTQNGRTVEINHIPTTCTSDKQGAANNIVPENKDRKPNGIIEPQLKHASPAKPPPLKSDRIAEPRIKPPHPDMKYLPEILTVPKLEELADFEEQDWLFQKSGTHMKQSEAEDTPQVWAEARWIESGDVYALPYVIPY